MSMQTDNSPPEFWLHSAVGHRHFQPSGPVPDGCNPGFVRTAFLRRLAGPRRISFVRRRIVTISHVFGQGKASGRTDNFERAANGLRTGTLRAANRRNFPFENAAQDNRAWPKADGFACLRFFA
jgi:hypothetical protein